MRLDRPFESMALSAPLRGGGSPPVQYLPSKVTEVGKETLKAFPHTKRVGHYLLGKTLGEGSFAKVKEGLHALTAEKVAIKVIDKKKAKEDAYVRKNLRREGKLLQMVRHRHVVQLFEIMETENSYYLVTELCRGGDLMDHICNRKRLDERETRRYIRQIISAVDYLHKLGILHRDLKVENLLLDENRDIKIIDFGLSNAVRVTHTKEGSTFQEFCVTQCGSPAYAAPELLGNKKYGPKVDVWSIGVNMYAMLTGNLPFTVEPFNIKALHTKMLSGDMNPLPDHLTDCCQDLLKRFLTPDPDKRITLQEAMNHPWIMEGRNRPVEPAPFPNRVRADELDNNLLKHMTNNMDFRMSEVIRLVTGNIPNSATAAYFLFVRRIQRHQAELRITGKVAASEAAVTNAIRPQTNFRMTAGDVIELLPVAEGDSEDSANTQQESSDSANPVPGPKITDLNLSPRRVPAGFRTERRIVRRQIRNARIVARMNQDKPDTSSPEREATLAAMQASEATDTRAAPLALLHNTPANDDVQLYRLPVEGTRLSLDVAGSPRRGVPSQRERTLLHVERERTASPLTFLENRDIDTHGSSDLPGINRRTSHCQEDGINNNTTEQSSEGRYRVGGVRRTSGGVTLRNTRGTSVQNSSQSTTASSNDHRSTISNPTSRPSHLRPVEHKGTASDPSTHGEKRSAKRQTGQAQRVSIDVGTYERFTRRGSRTFSLANGSPEPKINCPVRNINAQATNQNRRLLNLVYPTHHRPSQSTGRPALMRRHTHINNPTQSNSLNVTGESTGHGYARMGSLMRSSLDNPASTVPPRLDLKTADSRLKVEGKVTQDNLATVEEKLADLNVAGRRPDADLDDNGNPSSSTKDKKLALPIISPPLVTARTSVDS